MVEITILSFSYNGSMAKDEEPTTAGKTLEVRWKIGRAQERDLALPIVPLVTPPVVNDYCRFTKDGYRRSEEVWPLWAPLRCARGGGGLRGG